MWPGEKMKTRRCTVFGALCVGLMVAAYMYMDIRVYLTKGDSPDLSRNIYTEMLPKVKNVTKKMHIALLKVPKTGSSTLACIFLRYGFKNKLNMYLPKSSGFVSGDKQKLLQNEGKVYDIFVIHTYYDSTFFTHIMPRDSAIIGMVREPMQRIISQAFFHVKESRQEMVNLSDKEFIQKFLNNTNKYMRCNMMALYFGVKRNRMDTIDIYRYLESLNSRFSLVFVSEKYDESLVLLKRMLNWSFADILYGAKKVNKHEPVILSEKDRQNLYSNNMLDFEIYNYFKTKLENRIIQEGNDFQAEVFHFKNILSEVTAFCENNVLNGSKIEFPTSKWDHSFVVLSSECEWLFKRDVRDIREQYSNTW